MDSSQAENPCPSGGSISFTWGRLHNLTFLRGFNLLDIHTAEPVVARVCNYCGNVQTFLKREVQRVIDQSKREKRKRHG